jgi:rubrerythrin
MSQMSLQGTQTEKNLLIAFAGESQARNRYDMYAKQAKKEGFEQISAIFTETATQEQQHAKSFFKLLEGGDIEIQATFPAGIIGTTLENLKAAAAGEHHETTSMYPEFAEIAEQEGLKKIAAQFRAVAVAERRHEERYLKLAKNIEDGVVFKSGDKVRWICRKCGYVHEAKTPPKTCAACGHPQAYFELDALNY